MVRVKNRMLVTLGLGVLAAVIVLGGVANSLKIPISAVTLAGALILILFERRPLYRLGRVSWNVVFSSSGFSLWLKVLR